jgi:hypothetical protein
MGGNQASFGSGRLRFMVPESIMRYTQSLGAPARSPPAGHACVHDRPHSARLAKTRTSTRKRGLERWYPAARSGGG